jgi:hypothetical protein
MVPRTHSLFVVPVRAFERLWMFLWENGKNLISHLLSDNGSTGCVSGS